LWGLGIKNLEIQNKCLLSKWLFKLINEEGIWQNILRRKNLSNKTIAQVKKGWVTHIFGRAYGRKGSISAMWKV
jgi:hypothetical protein